MLVGNGSERRVLVRYCEVMVLGYIRALRLSRNGWAWAVGPAAGAAYLLLRVGPY